MSKRVFIIDPLEDDVLEHSLYLKSYENFCKKNKIDPCEFYICTESGRTYQLGSLLWSSKHNYVGEQRKLFTPYFILDDIYGRNADLLFGNSIFIVNAKLISFLPRAFHNVVDSFKNYQNLEFENVKPVIGKYVLNLVDGYYGLNLKDDSLSFGSSFRKTSRFAICYGLDRIPSKQYADQLSNIYKDILSFINKK